LLFWGDEAAGSEGGGGGAESGFCEGDGYEED